MEENINIKEEDNTYTFAEKTEDMKIHLGYNKSISLKNILDLTENLRETETIVFKDLGIEIEIFFIDKQYICFTICGKTVYDILRKPLTIQINEKDVEIVSSLQLDFILEKYYLNPKIYCSCGQMTDVTIRYLLYHKDHIFSVIEWDEIRPADGIEVNYFVNNSNPYFLEKYFSSPQEFEKNFNYYFKLGEKNKELKGPFFIFDDTKQNRYNIACEFIEYKNHSKKMNYFGPSGKGKSITLLGALKYLAPHKRIRTLYVNCKALKSLLEKEQFKTVKKILTDEIIYLFYEDYKNYLKCFEKIKSFNFGKYKSFWPLIDIILNECSQINRIYVIGFDQYDDSIDLNKSLDQFGEKYLKLKVQFTFIVISSMNEKDIRQKKMNLLFENISSKNVRELDQLLENFETNFNENQLDVFIKLGKTFKAFNEIQLYTNKNDEFNSYLKEKKKKYLFKLITFYNKGKTNEKYNPNLSIEEILNISEEDYKKILSFQINYEYSRTEILERINNIPFRFFNVTSSKSKYIVQPSFPLINEILNDIFKYIVVNKNFNAFKDLAKNKGNAFSSLFEYKVRYNFDPSIKGDIKYFKNFIIQRNVSMEIIVPKKTDKNAAPIFIQQLEKDKSYLVEQKQFGGKYLDFLIIQMSKNPKVFGFQVSTYKSEIFTSLQKIYETLIERLYISFKINVNENDAYFGYIFDYSRIDDPLYKPMLKNCKENNMKYSFYDIDTNSLFLDKDIQTTDIYDIVGKPLKTLNKKSIFEFQKTIDFMRYNPYYNLNGGQISTIIEILKDAKKDNNISSLKYLFSESNILNNDNYISIFSSYKEKLIIFFFANGYLISKIISDNKITENNDIFFSNSFDIYEIIKKK